MLVLRLQFSRQSVPWTVWYTFQLLFHVYFWKRLIFFLTITLAIKNQPGYVISEHLVRTGKVFSYIYHRWVSSEWFIYYFLISTLKTWYFVRFQKETVYIFFKTFWISKWHYDKKKMQCLVQWEKYCYCSCRTLNGCKLLYIQANLFVHNRNLLQLWVYIIDKREI